MFKINKEKLNKLNFMKENDDLIENALTEKESLGRASSPINTEKEKMMADRDKLIAERMNLSNNVFNRTPTGYLNIPIDSLPSKGRFYPINTYLQIRSATIESIKHYSIMNDNDEIDVRNHLLDLLRDNTRITVDNKATFNVEDLLEADKVFILLSIYELTYPNAENVIEIKSQCPKCGTHYSDKLSKNILTFKSYADEQIEKYYDDVNRCYTLKTKSFGNINLKPPTIGVSIKLYSEFKKSKMLNKYVNTSFFTLLPYIYMGKTLELNDNTILKLHDEFNENLTPKKYALIYRSIEKIEIGLEPMVVKQCTKEGCDNEYRFPFEITGGWKSLFVVFDPFDELI